ncbi:hypothetical protein GCM10027174_36390 [Salinifilum aidingensis]
MAERGIEHCFVFGRLDLYVDRLEADAVLIGHGISLPLSLREAVHPAVTSGGGLRPHNRPPPEGEPLRWRDEARVVQAVTFGLAR